MTDRRHRTIGAIPGPDLPADDVDTALAGMLLALTGGRRLVVLSGDDGAMRVDLLVRLARHLECDGMLVLGANGNSAATVEELVETAGRTGLGDAARHLGFDGLLKALDEKLEQSGAGVLVVDDAHRLAAKTLADLVDLPTSETETGRFVQLVLAGDPSLTDRLAPHLPLGEPAFTVSEFRLADTIAAGPGRAIGHGNWGRKVAAFAMVASVASVAAIGGWLAGAWPLPQSDAAPRLETWPEGAGLPSASEHSLPSSDPGIDTGPAWRPPVEPVVEQAVSPADAPPMTTSPDLAGDAALGATSGRDGALTTATPTTEPPSTTPPNAASPTPTLPAITPPGNLVTELLAEAEARFAANRLTTPEGSSAADSLQAVLALERGNSAVADLQARMLVTYRRWAAAAERRGDWDIARLFYRRALRVVPDDPGMTRLLGTLPDRQRQNRPLPAIPPVRTESVRAEPVGSETHSDQQSPPVPRLR